MLCQKQFMMQQFQAAFQVFKETHKNFKIALAKIMQLWDNSGLFW
jgi:hypothetical protein